MKGAANELGLRQPRPEVSLRDQASQQPALLQSQSGLITVARTGEHHDGGTVAHFSPRTATCGAVR